MRSLRVVLPLCVVGLLLVGLIVVAARMGMIVLAMHPPAGKAIEPATTATQSAAIRLGLIPERDIFAQRKAYRALADYLSPRLGRPLELVTSNSYERILTDFADQRVDVAFLGSLVGVLANDRHGAQVVAKPEYVGGISTYRGVVFVRDDSPIRTAEDLAGHSLGTVRTTTGGNVYPFFLLLEHGMLQEPKRPRIAWCGTHDDVIKEVAAGRLDAGGVKNLRLDAYEQAHPEVKFRRMGVSESVPENALFVRHDFDPALREALQKSLLGMAEDADGRKVLETLGMTRFVPCRIEDYKTVYDIVERLEPAWAEIGIDGPAPRRPSPSTAPSTANAPTP